jgi:transcriptional regulator with PAS, ATPase and Fis domain/tetratricopeptide (TPR) repeat protein
MDSGLEKVCQDQRLTEIRSLVEQKKFGQALAELREQESLARFGEDSQLQGEFLFLSALVLYHTGRYKEARQKGQHAFQIFKVTAANRILGEIQYILGAINQALGDFEEAETQLRDAIAAYRRIEDYKGIADCYNKLANLSFVRSDFFQSSEYLKKALDQAEQVGDQRMKAGILGNLGRIYSLLGQSDKAKENINLNLAANEKSGDEANLARSWLALAYVQLQQRESSAAKLSLQNAYDLIIANNLPRELAIYHEYFGELCVSEGNLKLAEEQYQKALEIGERIAPQGDIINQTYRLLAELKLLAGHYAAASKYANRSLEVSLQLGDRLEEGAAYRVLAAVFDHNLESGRAKKQISLALKLFQKTINDYELAKTYLAAGRLKSLDSLTGLKFLSKAEDIFNELNDKPCQAATYLTLAELLSSAQEGSQAMIFVNEAEKLIVGLDDFLLRQNLNELKSRQEMQVSQRQENQNARYDLGQILTTNPAMRSILQLADKFKDSDLSVFIEGETGTGKDLLAKAIHYSSRRRDKKYIAVNCSAIPEALLENQLFGYAKGAYTGAEKDKPGLIEIADGGTFYLDEIADAPLSIQVKLLRMLETKELVRLGDTEPRKIDVRFVASTNRDLNQALEEGRIRQDLYYRLCGVRLSLPPLRERKEDIPALLQYFLKEAGPAYHDLTEVELAEIYSKLQAYDWPGNVRELENEIKRSVVMAGIKERNLFELLLEKFEGLRNGNGTSLNDKVAEFEKSLILQALRATNWVKTKAAKILGIPESTLRHKIETYQLNPEKI